MLLELQGIAKTYESPSGEVVALQAMDLQIKRGEVISFVGRSGCGKSTLLHIIAGLVAPSAGRVLFNGQPIVEPDRKIGIMFQSPVLLPWRTIEKNVLLPVEVFGGDMRDYRERARQILTMVGLGEFLASYPRHLSGGMQQRAALARVLLCEPEVLLLDEPFGALDEFTREAMNVELLKIAHAANLTVFFVTHNIAEAVLLSDRVVVMTPRPGRVAGVLDIGLERPRTIEMMHQPLFNELTFQVRHMLGGYR